MDAKKIGVLALQGNFREHITTLRKLSEETNLTIETIEVRLPKDLENLHGLIIPGGESTTIIKLLKLYQLDSAIRQTHEKGMKIFGTCAGAIILAKETNDKEVPGLSLIDITIQRNAYGRQIDSFETELTIEGVGSFPGRFIRAPKIKTVRKDIEVLCTYNGDVVLVKNKSVLVATFHPELTPRTQIHQLFLSML